MSHDTDPHRASVEAYLDLLRRDHEALDRQDAYLVHLAYRYGYTVPEIAARTRLDILRVQLILSSPEGIF